MPARASMRGQIQEGYQLQEVRQSFMKYTSQMIIKDL